MVAVQGPGATALALGLVAGPSAAGSWVVGVGAPEVGLLAAAELGVDLERMVVVDAPPRAQWGTVVAAVAEAFDVVLVRHHHQVRPGDARRLAARVRERGGVLVQLPGRSGAWPDAPDLTFTLSDPDWRGVAADRPRRRPPPRPAGPGGRGRPPGRRPAAGPPRSGSPAPTARSRWLRRFRDLGTARAGPTSRKREPAVLEQAG